jgi:hypothetical protein
MEVASAQPALHPETSMDIDMDLDLGPVPETEPILTVRLDQSKPSLIQLI